jgi:DNA polymerase-3 subunit gamma/tau
VNNANGNNQISVSSNNSNNSNSGLLSENKKPNTETTNPVVQKTVAWKTSPSIPSGIGSIPKINTLETIQKKEEIRTEEVKENTSRKINENQFNDILDNFLSLLQANGKDTLHAIISQKTYKLHYNKCLFGVQGEFQRSLLEKERDVFISYMRKQTGINDLFLEVIIDNDLAPIKKVAYTSNEKFEEMAAKNPTLIKLKELFKTRIVD